MDQKTPTIGSKGCGRRFLVTFCLSKSDSEIDLGGFSDGLIENITPRCISAMPTAFWQPIFSKFQPLKWLARKSIMPTALFPNIHSQPCKLAARWICPPDKSFTLATPRGTADITSHTYGIFQSPSFAGIIYPKSFLSYSFPEYHTPLKIMNLDA